MQQVILVKSKRISIPVKIRNSVTVTIKSKMDYRKGYELFFYDSKELNRPLTLQQALDQSKPF